MAYNRQLMEEFHKLNHTHTLNTVFTNIEFSTIPEENKTIDESESIIIRNLSYGIYKINIGDNNYSFILNDSIYGDDQYIKIINPLNAFIITPSTRKFIRLYLQNNLYDEITNSYILSNTVNAHVNKISVNGYTDFILPTGVTEQSPTNIATIKPISEVNIVSYNSDKSAKDNMIIHLKNPIKSTPNGVFDLFTLDCDNYIAEILFKVGRLTITGNEDWEYMKALSNDTYSIFFLSFDLIKVSIANDNIVCNYFPATSYNGMINNIKTPYCVSSYEDDSSKGIYVLMPNTVVDKDVLKFKSYLRNLYKSNPVIIDYELSDYDYKTIILDDYRINTFYPKTILEINYPTKIACYAKTIKR